MFWPHPPSPPFLQQKQISSSLRPRTTRLWPLGTLETHAPQRHHIHPHKSLFSSASFPSPFLCPDPCSTHHSSVVPTAFLLSPQSCHHYFLFCILHPAYSSSSFLCFSLPVTSTLSPSFSPHFLAAQCQTRVESCEWRALRCLDKQTRPVRIILSSSLLAETRFNKMKCCEALQLPLQLHSASGYRQAGYLTCLNCWKIAF